MASLLAADLHSPVVDAALNGAARALGMELVFIASVGADDDDEFTFIRLSGELPGVVPGVPRPREESMCHYMLRGAPGYTCDAGHDPAYTAATVVGELGITSYVGAPIRIDGKPVGTLCGLDRQVVALPDGVVKLLSAIADIIGAHVRDSDELVLRRSAAGWRVGWGDDLDLTNAMVLADLLAEAQPMPRRPSAAQRGAMSEIEGLRLAISQLEYALSARVVVEQAIGIVAERHGLAPRPAFERLRTAARTRGRRVHDLADDLVRSASDDRVSLPPELARH